MKKILKIILMWLTYIFVILSVVSFIHISAFSLVSVPIDILLLNMCNKYISKREFYVYSGFYYMDKKMNE